MIKSTSSTIGLLLLAAAHVACGGARGGAEPTNDRAAAGEETGSGAGGKSTGTSGSKAGGKALGSDASGDNGTNAGDGEPGDLNGSGGTGSAPAPLDSDGDGVADDRDLCPETAAGTKVASAGCALSSDKGAQVPWGQAVPAGAASTTPVTGTVEPNGFMTFVVDPRGAAPMVFRAHQQNVQKLEYGYRVTGAILLDIPGSTLTLTDVDVTFELNSSNLRDGIKTLHGSARVPFPDFGAPESVEVEAPIATLGLELGQNLADLKAPLVNERQYLYFDFSDQMSAKVGGMALQLPAATRHTLVLDHTDPMFFVRANLSGMPGMPLELENAGIGFSRQGKLPFVPTNTWGLGEANGLPAAPLGFSGQMYLEIAGGVEIPGTPVMLTAESVNVIDLDPARKGRTVFTDPEQGLRLGTNRSLGVKLDLIPGTAEFELEMGNASLDSSLLQDAQTAAISGVIYPGKSFFNDVVPILPSSEVRVAAAIASPVSDSRFAMAGDVSMQLSKLGGITGLSLSDVPLASTVLTADKNGLSVHGVTGVSFLQMLGVDGSATFDAVFPGASASSDWFVDINGNVSIGGTALDGTTNARLDRRGIALNGHLKTKLSTLVVSGVIDRSGVKVAGYADITIPIVAGRKELQTFVNGAVCGYNQVTSAAKCGTKLITGWAECGVSYFKSCVLKHKCGTPSCDGPAKTCSDWNSPLACEQEVTIPAYNFGTFRGAVRVELGQNGASASVIGAYCSALGDCVSVPTSASVSDSRACVQVPEAGNQTFCVSF